MVIIEAMACALPVVSFDCPSGPAEIIDNGHTGVLVENGNVAAMAKAIDKVIDDEEWRAKASTSALESARRYSVENVMGKWQCLFTSLQEKNTQKKPHR